MRTILVSCCIACITLYSCKKDKALNSTNLIANDSIYLARVFLLDTTRTAPLDTMRVELYTYDALKRVITSSISVYNNTGAPTTVSNYQYYYNGSDTLPYKQYYTHTNSSLNATQEMYMYYVSGTRDVYKDSLIYFQDQFAPPVPIMRDTTVNHYDYLPGILKITSEYYNGTYHLIPSIYKAIGKDNGNIISQVDTTGAVLIHNYNCIYDNHPNPYYNVAWYNNKYLDGYYTSYTDAYGLNNNVTEINNTEIDIFSPDFDERLHLRYTYTYRQDGYPTEIVIQDLGSTNNFHTVNKVKYFYTD